MAYSPEYGSRTEGIGPGGTPQFVGKMAGRAQAAMVSYEELAKLYQDSMNGDATAAIALAQLPEGEQRLAKEVFKAFGGRAIKTKNKKPAVTKAAPSRPPLTDQQLLNRMAYNDFIQVNDPRLRDIAATQLPDKALARIEKERRRIDPIRAAVARDMALKADFTVRKGSR